MESSIPRTTSAHRYPLTLGALLDGAVAAHSGQEIVSGERRLTYSDLGDRVHRLAAGLHRLGVSPGDTVAVLDWDTHRYLECFFAVPMMGAVLHMVNVRLSPEQILYTINHAQDDVILVNREFLPLIEDLRGRMRTVRALVIMDDEERSLPDGFDDDYERLVTGPAGDYRFPEIGEDARATTFYTTGTTGEPKGVYFSHRQLMLHTFAVQAACAGSGQGRFNPDDVYMPMTPMFHVHAWGLPYVATLLGAKQVYPGRYEPGALLALIRREGVTFSHCVPTILRMLLDHPDAAATDLERWTVIIGGAAMPPALCREALARGIDVFSGYGLSETCPVLTLAQLPQEMTGVSAVDEQVAQRCKTGRAIPLVQLRVVDGQMRDLPADGSSQGEVVVRAPWLTQGYLYDPERSEALWHGGWLHTGDLGVLDPDGYLRITDRLKDVIKTGGEWVSSLAVESLLLGHPDVAEAAVVGVADERWGERPVAMVVAWEGTSPTSDALCQWVSEQLGSTSLPVYAVPDRVEVVEAIPRTSVGKVDKKRIRTALEERL